MSIQTAKQSDPVLLSGDFSAVKERSESLRRQTDEDDFVVVHLKPSKTDLYSTKLYNKLEGNNSLCNKKALFANMKEYY